MLIQATRKADAAGTRYLADRGTASAAVNGTHDPLPEQYHRHYHEQSAATTPPREPLTAADGPGVKPNTDVREQGNGIVLSGHGKETLITAEAS